MIDHVICTSFISPIISYAQACGIRTSVLELQHFQDGEINVSLDQNILNNPGKSVLLCHHFSVFTGPLVNQQLLDLMLLAKMLRDAGVNNLVGFFPYLAYSRQDRAQFPFEMSVRSHVFELLASAGFDSLITIDAHAATTLQGAVLPIENISAVPLWYDVIKQNFFQYIQGKNICLVSPDAGGLSRVQELAQALAVPFAVISKVRTSPSSVASKALHGDVFEKHVIIVDDILHTGNTALQAALLVKELGARSIHGCFTHAHFVPDTQKFFVQNLFDSITVTDTCLPDQQALPSKISVISSMHMLQDVLNIEKNHEKYPSASPKY